VSYTNQEIADLIYKIDPDADWIYNNYCSFCGQFLYPEHLLKKLCKKCQNSTSTSIKRTISFVTSGTALEKVLLWIKNKHLANRDEDVAAIYYVLLLRILDVTNEWLLSGMDTFDYRQRTIDIIGETLAANIDVLCHV
jgi:hypothetical protein